MKTNNSKRYKARADKVIAHGALTNSKRASCFVEGIYPTHFKSGYKCYLVDVDNNKYIDMICGLGTNLFGYGHRGVVETVLQTALRGNTVFSMSSDVEVEFAEKFVEEHPWIDKIRVLKSGSEGCSAAVKIARAFTGKRFVYSEGYHGWHDGFVQLTPPAHGVAGDRQMLSIGDFVFPDAAAVIVEPIITDYSKERIQWLQRLREACTAQGVVLIFDETITAYRYEQGSVTRRHNIHPDLWIGGKAIAAGYPLSVVGGRAEIMDADYFVSSTWAGDRIAMASGIKAIELLHGDYQPDDLWSNGKILQSEFNRISPEVQMVGYPTRGVFKYSSDLFKALFMQEMSEAGILIGPSWFINKWHDLERQNIISIAKIVIKNIINGKCKLYGKIPGSPFAEKVRTK
jgi:glutamate-1-semialdehyde aminotransferase